MLGLGSLNKLAEAAVGGTHPGVTTITKIVPNRDPYTYDAEPPADRGHPGPGLLRPAVRRRRARSTSQPPAFHTGANPYNGPQPTPNEAALTTLLGLLAGGATLP